MREKEKIQFFAKKKNYNTVKVGGVFGFSSLPKHMQESIKERLAKKDDVMARGLSGELPGILIDGKKVTKDNIHEFEKKSKGAKAEVDGKKLRYDETKEKWKEEPKHMTKKELGELSFSELKKIAKKLGETGRSSTGLIKDILKHNK